jgi:hypothetical protein
MAQSRAEHHPRGGSRASVPCLAVSGTAETFCAAIRASRLHLPASLPSGRFCCPPLSAALPHRYYEGSDSCRPHLRSTGLSAYSALPSRHSVPNHAGCPMAAFSVAPAPPVASRLRPERAGSPQLHAESGSSACGLPVHLRLLSTPPRGDAVTFDYEPTTGLGADLHRADKASSRTHSSLRKRGPRGKRRKSRVPAFAGTTTKACVQRSSELDCSLESRDPGASALTSVCRKDRAIADYDARSIPVSTPGAIS